MDKIIQGGGIENRKEGTGTPTFMGHIEKEKKHMKEKEQKCQLFKKTRIVCGIGNISYETPVKLRTEKRVSQVEVVGYLYQSDGEIEVD